MIGRTATCFGTKPEWLAVDTASNLDWLVNEQRAAPYIPVHYIPVIDKSKHDDGTFSRGDFTA
jgi:hypothetical protein